MHYIRGSRHDYDRWANELGNANWSYEKVLPYFKKIEDMQIDELRSSPFHGTDGPISVTAGPKTPLGDVYSKAAESLGYDVLLDPNGASQEGFNRAHFVIGNGKRQSTAECYLRPAMKRKNMHVLTHAHATKIVITSSNGKLKATGVQYVHHGLTRRVRARREVILASGAINSPQLLMLSGIGPKEHLESLGIRVLLDNPAVGSNLQDHPYSYVSFAVNKSIATQLLLQTDGWRFKMALAQWYLFGTGILASTPVDVNAFLRSSLADDARPDLQLYLASADLFGKEQVFNLKPHIYLNSTKTKAIVSGYAVLLHPRSLGEIRLLSSDPFDPPSIDPNMMADERDARTMADGLRVVLDIAQSQQMALHGCEMAEDGIPECRHIAPLWSREYLECHGRQRLMALFHPVGTCRMGPKGRNSVVDERLRVHGVDGLRIVDASVFPDQVSGNTNIPVIMVAEKASDMIKDDAQKHAN